MTTMFMQPDCATPLHDEAASFVMAPPLPVTPAMAEAILRRHYGLAGRASPLESERDRIFRMTAEDGAEYLLRLTNPAEDPQVTSMQTAVLRYLAEVAPHLPVQRILPARSGALEEPISFGNGTATCIARLMPFLPGRPLGAGPIVSAQLRAAGAVLADLARAMRDFRHPAAHHALYWDIQHLPKLRGLLPCLPDDASSALARRSFDRFAQRVQPVLPGLRAQVLHNDLHPANVLVDEAVPERITGLLDFGDMTYTALVNDIAVAAQRLVTLDGPPLADVAEFVAAYHAVTPLDPVELALLPDLIMARLTITMLVRARQSIDRPGSVPSWAFARAALERLHALPAEAASGLLLAACGATAHSPNP